MIYPSRSWHDKVATQAKPMLIVFALAFSLLLLPLFWPGLDLAVSRLFYQPAQGFYLADHPFLVALHWTAYDGARVLGVAFAVLAAVARMRRQSLCGIDAKGWLFLLLALLIAPGLIANVGFKDHWGRYRPREIVEFGGTQIFTPAFEPHFEHAHSNGSFVSGDGAFGFFLPAFAFVVPRRKALRIFWLSMGVGILFGGSRIIMGAHFFSDVVSAAWLMLASISVLYAACYGWGGMRAHWLLFFSRSSGEDLSVTP